jgi:hypothetical protein
MNEMEKYSVYLVATCFTLKYDLKANLVIQCASVLQKLGLKLN